MMKKFVTLFVALFCLMTFGFVNDAQAQAAKEGFDARVGLSAGIMDLGIKNPDFSNAEMTQNHALAGLGTNLMIGYRMKYVGGYVNLDLGGLFDNVRYDDDKRNEYADCDKYEGKAKDACENHNAGGFIGSALIEVHGFYPITDKFQIEGAFGMGVIFSENNAYRKADDDKFGRLTIIEPDSTDYIKSGKDEDKGHAAAFALKFGFAGTYYITDMIGVGLHVDYVLGIKNYGASDDDDDEEREGKQRIKYHHVMPGIHARVRF